MRYHNALFVSLLGLAAGCITNKIPEQTPAEPAPAPTIVNEQPAAPDVIVEGDAPPTIEIINVPSGEAPITTAPLCLEWSFSDQTTHEIIPVLDENQMVTDCTPVETVLEHRVSVPVVMGYKTPLPRVIPANTLRPGTIPFTIAVVYELDRTWRCIDCRDDHFDMPLACRIEHLLTDGRREESVGQMCVWTVGGDIFSVYSEDMGDTIAKSFDASLLEPFTTVRFHIEHAAQLRLNITNDQGQIMGDNAVIYLDNVEVKPDGSYIIDNRTEHRLLFQTKFEAGNPALQPLAYYIAAFAIPDGETRVIEKIYYANSMSGQLKQVCGITLGGSSPSEAFIGGRSIGWSLSTSEVACDYVARDTELEVTFSSAGELDTKVLRYPIANPGVMVDYYVHLYDPEHTAVLCPEARTPEGQTFSATVSIDEVSYEAQYLYPMCVVRDPAMETTLKYASYGFYRAPPAETLPAGTLTAGEITIHVGQYMENWERGIVYVYGPSLDDGSSVRLKASSYYYPQSQYEQNSDTVYTEFSPTSQPRTLVWKPIENLMSPPALTISSASAAESATWNEQTRTWEWQVYYSVSPSAGAVALMCGEATDASDRFLDQEQYLVDIDGNDPRATFNSRPCSYVRVDQPHSSAGNWLLGHSQPENIYVPAGMLRPGGVHIYRLRYVPQDKTGTICITTAPSRGEIYVNGASVGWTPVKDGRLCVVVDAELEQRVSASSSTVVIAPNTIDQFGMIELNLTVE